VAHKKIIIELDRAEIGQALYGGLTSRFIQELLIRCLENGDISSEDVTRCLTEKASGLVKNSRGGVTAAVVKQEDNAAMSAEVTFHWLGD